MIDKEREEFEWKIQILQEHIERLKKENHVIRRSKTVAAVVCKEGDHFRRLMLLKTHPSAEGIMLVVEDKMPTTSTAGKKGKEK